MDTVFYAPLMVTATKDSLRTDYLTDRACKLRVAVKNMKGVGRTPKSTDMAYSMTLTLAPMRENTRIILLMAGVV